jgi:hypothetical protein
MAFLDKSKANYAFKALLGKAHTSDNKELANETLMSGVTTQAQYVWAKPVAKTAAAAVSAGTAAYVSNIPMEAVSGAILSGIQVSYRAKLSTVPASLTGKINPFTQVAYAAGDYLGQFIPESYGVTGSSDYRPILKNNGNEVAPLDSADWFLDSFSGSVTREADSDSLTAWAGPMTISGYIYIGDMASNLLNPVDNSWHSIDIEPGAGGVIKLGDKTVHQGFVINYIMKMGTDIQYGNISVIHNGITVSDPPFNEFYFVENESSVAITSDFNGNIVEIDLQNNDPTNHATFKYRIIEKIDLI